jgi:2-alkyl-3-oxoalkanoate reductase
MKALVTGGGGFLGQAIVRKLRARGDAVRSISRSTYPELANLGVEQFRGDLTDAGAIEKAAAGCDLILHVAAKAGIWGRYEEYYRTNVVGTENVIAACRKLGVQRLVYTSSPSVVFTGHDHENVNELAPYAERFLAHYPATKAIAEKHVLEANGPVLATVALRPHLIWGPGDHHLIPRLIERAKAGKLRRIGDGKNRVDTIYIDNAADAHLLAADRLQPGSPIAGKAYFLSNGEPVVLWNFINRILAAAHIAPVTKGVSATTAYALGAVLELVYRTFGIRSEPRMTRFLAKQLSTSHWFDLTAARRDLGYQPAVSIDEGLKRLEKWLAENARPN